MALRRSLGYRKDWSGREDEASVIAGATWIPILQVIEHVVLAVASNVCLSIEKLFQIVLGREGRAG